MNKILCLRPDFFYLSTLNAHPLPMHSFCCLTCLQSKILYKKAKVFFTKIRTRLLFFQLSDNNIFYFCCKTISDTSFLDAFRSLNLF